MQERLDAVSLQDVDRVIARVLGGPRVVAAVGPFSEDDFS
jgi:predicted Zn-dependent peptidase